jgi:hypothetical protein
MEAEPGTTHLGTSEYKGFQVNPPLALSAPPIDPLYLPADHKQPRERPPARGRGGCVAHGNDPDIAGLGFSKDRNIGVTQADQDRNGGLRVA